MRVLALVIPLSLDSFAVAAGLAAAGLKPRDRVGLAILFPTFEVAMPVVGLVLGRAVAEALGHVASYAAAAVLLLLGLVLLLDLEAEPVHRLVRARGIAVFALALVVSLDELALGFTIGLLRLSLVLALALIAAQAVVASQLGLAFGARLGAAVAGVAERLAGAILIAIGIVFLALAL